MSTRTVSALVLCCTTLGTALACSSQPLAPSSVGSTRALDPARTFGVLSPSQPDAASPSRFGSRTPGVVFVTSQGLYYDTFVVRDPLPMEGRFQLIANGQTEFGPGQPGYIGGRWWEDLNGDGAQDPEDHYFLCPLLPPGRSTP